jgi:hypothetical protein
MSGTDFYVESQFFFNSGVLISCLMFELIFRRLVYDFVFFSSYGIIGLLEIF